MSTAENHIPVKSHDDVLARFEMHTVFEDGTSSKMQIYSYDGEFVVAVSTEISVDDLECLLRFGRSEFNRGQRVGEDSLKMRFRSLFDLAVDAGETSVVV